MVSGDNSDKTLQCVERIAASGWIFFVAHLSLLFRQVSYRGKFDKIEKRGIFCVAKNIYGTFFTSYFFSFVARKVV